MSKQHRQAYPHALRVGVGRHSVTQGATPEAAMISLYEAIGHKHPRASDESEAEWKDRLKAVAVNLINSEGAILIRAGDTGGSEATYEYGGTVND